VQCVFFIVGNDVFDMIRFSQQVFNHLLVFALKILVHPFFQDLGFADVQNPVTGFEQVHTRLKRDMVSIPDHRCPVDAEGTIFFLLPSFRLFCLLRLSFETASSAGDFFPT